MEPDPRPLGLHPAAPHRAPQNLPHCKVPGGPEGHRDGPLGEELVPQFGPEGSSASLSKECFCYVSRSLNTQTFRNTETAVEGGDVVVMMRKQSSIGGFLDQSRFFFFFQTPLCLPACFFSDLKNAS